MQDLALTRSYDRSAAPPEDAAKAGAPLRTDRFLNYVWINKVPDKDQPPPADDTPLCSVPLHYLDRAYDNARKYPDTEVRIWIDEARLSDQTRFFVQSHAYLNAPGNVRFKDLNSIPAYAAARDIYAGADISIWYKTDLARFQVAEHCMHEKEARIVHYADFDVRDVELDSKATQGSLARHGTAFTRVPGKNIPSPGYFAACKEGLPVIENVIEMMENAIREGGDHYQALRKALPQSKWYALQDKFTDIVLPPENVEMVLPDIYGCETGLCKRPPSKKYDLS